jgi:hypothetical protein
MSQTKVNNVAMYHVMKTFLTNVWIYLLNKYMYVTTRASQSWNMDVCITVAENDHILITYFLGMKK